MPAAGAMRTTMRQTLLVCPACDKDIEAEIALKALPVDVQAGSGIQKQVTLNAELAGVKFDHDCLPKATRGRGRPPGSVNKPKATGGYAATEESEELPKVADGPAAGGATPEEHREALRGLPSGDNPLHG